MARSAGTARRRSIAIARPSGLSPSDWTGPIPRLQGDAMTVQNLMRAVLGAAAALWAAAPGAVAGPASPDPCKVWRGEYHGPVRAAQTGSDAPEALYLGVNKALIEIAIKPGDGARPIDMTSSRYRCSPHGITGAADFGDAGRARFSIRPAGKAVSLKLYDIRLDRGDQDPYVPSDPILLSRY